MFDHNSDIKQQAHLLKYDSKREIPRSLISFTKQIGSGNFGNVSKGKLRGLSDPNLETTVAIKSINGPAEGADLRDFLREIKIMSYIKPHLNLVSMIGSCSSELENRREREMLLIIEFCHYGDLKIFLSKRKNEILSGPKEGTINSKSLLYWAHDVSKGMQFLSNNKIMHGDLAARNIMLDDNPLEHRRPVAKVADFGLSKNFYDKQMYHKESRVFVPWKWMAIEYLTDEFFTLTSDVWSFGVVLWEILSFGKMPYGQQEYNEVLDRLEGGYRLPCPADVENLDTWSPRELYDELAEICFEADPDKRATFTMVVERIEAKLSKDELSEYEEMNSNYQSTCCINYLKLGERGSDT
jgi:serine/threonine protein kinase